MTEKELLEIIAKGEGHTTEFKKSTSDLTKDVFESICAFYNRDGGHIFLGVKDNGEILGVEKGAVEKIKKDFVTAINNTNKMYPPLFFNAGGISGARKNNFAYLCTDWCTSKQVCRTNL